MATSITALFASRSDADQAKAKLCSLGIAATAVRVQNGRFEGDGYRLSTNVSDEVTESALAILHDTNLLDLVHEHTDPPDQDWINNQNGRVTSKGVLPGQGDSEAGDVS